MKMFKKFLFKRYKYLFVVLVDFKINNEWIEF